MMSSCWASLTHSSTRRQICPTHLTIKIKRGPVSNIFGLWTGLQQRNTEKRGKKEQGSSKQVRVLGDTHHLFRQRRKGTAV
ncbi:hypothetical protein DIPPA_27748 [Diplonema papillatum]|nr:hypothetical protein DIPPA_27748 [Diplonema papillatum]